MKLQNKVQKVVCYIVLATCAIAFFFALGLATNFFNLMFIRVLGIRGGNLFKEIQPFNRKLVSSIIIMIVLVVSLFISRTHIRRRYYISNYIATILVVAVNISVSIWGILNVLEFRNRFLTEVDFETWATYNTSIRNRPLVGRKYRCPYISSYCFTSLIGKFNLENKTDEI